jgi:hypothetical protein
MKLVNMLKFTMKILICIFCIMDLMANIYLLGLMFIYKDIKKYGAFFRRYFG